MPIPSSGQNKLYHGPTKLKIDIRCRSIMEPNSFARLSGSVTKHGVNSAQAKTGKQPKSINPKLHPKKSVIYVKMEL